MRKTKTHEISHRLTALLLCLCMIVSMISGVGISRASAEGAAGSGTGGVTRQADPSTMDTYQDMLDFSESTRYAGRLWSDKTVFALSEDKAEIEKNAGDRLGNWDGSSLTLTTADDGVSGSIGLDEDFLHVYSALGSSLELDDSIKGPYDVVILLDMSGSMGTDLKSDEWNDTTIKSGSEHKTLEDRIKHSRIYSVLESINECIEELMDLHATNRVAVIGYGATAAVILPLGHYEKIEGEDGYVKVDAFTDYGETNFSNLNKKGSAAYTVTGHANLVTMVDGEKHTDEITNKVRNDYARDGQGSDVKLIGYHTDLQAGIYLGFNELYRNLDENDRDTYSYTYTSKLTNEETTIPRVPVAFVMTDGGSNYALKENSPAPATGDEWKAVPFVEETTEGTYGYDGSYEKYRAESNKDGTYGGGEAVILDILMTASYMKSKIINKYDTLFKNIKDSPEAAARKEAWSFPIHTISVDTPSDNWQIPRVYAALDPKDFFSNTLKSVTVGEQTIDPNTWKQKDDVTAAYKTFVDWEKATDAVSITFHDTEKVDRTVNFNQLNGDPDVKKEDITSNILYNDSFADINAGSLTDHFTTLIGQLGQDLFTPVAGENDLGVGDSVTYMDPVGKYMEVKDVKNLALFGELYDITKTAVYDYRWNDAYIKAMEDAGKEGYEQGSTPLPQGWYRGEPTKDAEFVPQADGLPSDCGTADAAWAAGWVFRVNYQTAAQFVPTLKEINDPSMAEKKERQTEYTFYRIDSVDGNPLNSAARNELRRNPAYGDTIPAGAPPYDPNEQTHLETPGVYALSDLRIWVEDSGDYNDTLGEALTDTNYDEALWVNIPVNMLPLRRITVTAGDGSDEITYSTNIPDEGATISPNPAESASFPLRVFYTVGVSDEALGNSNQIDIAGSIDAEYILKNKITTAEAAAARGIDQGNVEFFSNWYNPLNRYSDYATTNTDYTFGDPVTSFSPADGNRYYMFQKALPLYSHAYIFVQEGTDPGLWRRVNIEEDYATKDPEGRTFNATAFGGNLLADNLEVTGLSADPSSNTDLINAALKDVEPTNGDIVLLKSDILGDVNRDTPSGDPFPSEGYFFLAIDYYNLKADKTAEYTQYVITRKGSEFGSTYNTAGISNGEMLVWHDVSGKYTQDYPYLSATDTNDNSRGRDWIGWPLDECGYYKTCDKSSKDKNQWVPVASNYGVAKGEASGYADTWDTQHDNVLKGGTWVVCAKPGGLRVGGLSQAVQSKTTPEDTTFHPYPPEYLQARFGESYKSSDTWGYYSNNVTRTANNYYMPTISTGSTIDDVRVNVYLGNNGRLYVQDTTLLVTKLVEPPDGSPVEPDEEFNFQVFINSEGFENSEKSAIVVQWNPATGSWQRQFHYIDLELDQQLFLQTEDGQKAMVDKGGKRLIPNPDGAGYVYADDSTSTYNAGDDGGPYYVYIGRNRVSEESIGSTDTSFRVYHNNAVDENGTVAVQDAVIVETSGGAGTIKAAEVWLVSQTKYSSEWVTEGVPVDPTAGGFDIGAKSNDTLTNFDLLTIDPNISNSTEISITTPYRTNSAYWTKTVEFGVNANPKDGGPSEVGKPLTVGDLYDQEIPAHSAGLTNEVVMKRTAEFTLKHGQALLFSGIPSGAAYRVTEKLTDAQIDAGYTLKEVVHKQQSGSATESPGADFTGVYSVFGDTSLDEKSANFVNTFNRDKTETAINGDTSKPTGDGSGFQPGVQVGDTITYQIKWANTTGAEARVVIIDPLDTGVDFAGATAPDGGTWKYFDADQKDEANAFLATIYTDLEKPVTMDSGHVVIWDLGDQANGSSGSVTLTVEVNENAAKWWDYDGDGEADVPVDPDDYQVRNRATVRVVDNFYNTNTVVNPVGQPDKTETLIDHADTGSTDVKVKEDEPDANLTDPDGDGTWTGPLVYVGDKITYEITWRNYENVPALITIRDPLDANVKLISASFDQTKVEVRGEKPDTWPSGLTGEVKLDVTSTGDTKPESRSTTGKTVNVSTTEEPNSVPVIRYTNTSGECQVVWNLGFQPAGASGKVTLVVEVLSTATPAGYVDNTAFVKVNGDAEQQTKTVENPTPEVKKTERTPGDGQRVKVGQTVDYVISWNSHDTAHGAGEKLAGITVTDPLDPGVDFVSASYGGVTLNADTAGSTAHSNEWVVDEDHGETVEGQEGKGHWSITITYDRDKHMVTWVLYGEKAATDEGHVNLTVKVTERTLVNEDKALTAPEGIGSAGDWNYRNGSGIETEGGQEVQNRGAVKFGSDANIVTNLVENPVGPMKEEVTPGDGEQVQIGEEIHYRIYWQNYHSDSATVTVEDPLDPGVDFVRAVWNGTTLTANDDGSDCHTTEKVTLPEGSAGVSKNVPVIQYFDGEGEEYTLKHCVVWNLGEQNALADGYVDLYVKVNEKAYTHWQYGTGVTPDMPEIKEGEKDHEVVNRAGVTVGSDSKIYTDVMENPVPEKTETQITPADGGAGTTVSPEAGNLKPKTDKEDTVVGPLVKVGDVITYEISWKNGYDKPADVTVTDVLDMGRNPCGVDFESASFKEIPSVVLTADEVKGGKSGESDAEAGVTVSCNDGGQPVVTWNLKGRPAGAEGTVILKVKVNGNALVTGCVDNQAQVTVGSNSKYTGIVENPTPELEKTETKPGAGMQVMPGDQVDYEISWNNYQAVAAKVVVRDTLDPGVNFSSASFTGDNGATVEITWNGEPTSASIDYDPAEDGPVMDDPQPGPSENAPTPESAPETSSGAGEREGLPMNMSAGPVVFNEPGEADGDGSTEPDDPNTPAEPGGNEELNGSEGSGGGVEPGGSEGSGSEVEPGGSEGSGNDADPNGGERSDEPAGDPAANDTPQPVDEPAGGTPIAGKYPVQKPTENITESGTVKIGDNDVKVTITYNYETHTITWTLGGNDEGDNKVPAGYAGVVKFSVIVNDQAETLHTYGDDGNFKTGETGTDNQILNQGGVTVGTDDEVLTNIIPNPTEPEKDETEINDRKVTVTSDGNIKTGPEVQVGDVITYTITWQNTAVDGDGNGKAANITVIDTFRTAGLEFVAAGFVKVDENGEESYPEGTPASGWSVATGTDEMTGLPNITWKMPNQDFGASGKVWVKARVTEDAVTKVVNGATVYVGDDSQRVNDVENPVSENGGLRVAKTVTGGGDRSREWHFTVTLTGSAADGTLPSGVNGGYGDMTFYSGVAKFTLRHGESKTATGLPARLGYKVVEEEAGKDNYTTTASGDTGTVPRNGIAKAGFVNSKPDDPPPPDKPQYETGGLTVRKTVALATPADKDVLFTFTVKLTGSGTDKKGDTVNAGDVDGKYGGMNFTDGVAAFTLKDGQSVTATGLPAGLGYTVTEQASEDFTSHATGASGVIPAGGTAEAGFVNTRSDVETGGLTVTKTVTGTESDAEREFHFTVTLDDKSIEGTYGGMTFTQGVAKFSLRSGQSVTAKDLPAGVGYTVAEDEADQDGYATKAEGDSGAIPKDGEAKAAFVNTKGEPTGSLTVTKIVTGKDGDKEKAFHFIVTLDDTSISGPYGGMTFTGGVAQFDLRHGESVTADKLPVGVGYTVAETDVDGDGYTTSYTGRTGTIPENDVVKSTVVNHKDLEELFGDLEVVKHVGGTAGDKNRAFHFTVTLDDTSISGPYGGMTFTGGAASFELRDGESVTASGLPAGVGYTVTEAEADQDGYVTSATGEAGAIPGGDTARAEFRNNKGQLPPGTGRLVVRKVVTGTDGDTDRAFHFTVTLDNTSIDGAYGDMTFTGGVARFTLRSGENMWAKDLPVGTGFTVTETEADQDGYATAVTGGSGTIPESGYGVWAEARFLNRKDDEEFDEPDIPFEDLFEDLEDPDIPLAEFPDVPTDTQELPPDDDIPDTGDNSRLGLWLALMLISLGGMAALIPFLGKRRRDSGRGDHGRK